MKFHNVVLAGLGYRIPAESWSSDELERRLAPAYKRLRLPAGRLELMTGIGERRVFAPGTQPSQHSAASVRLALQAADLPPQRVGALIHASVCRDHLEPGTSCIVHRLAGLSPHCLLYDVSNACLGFLNGIIQLALHIEAGHFEVGVVVSSENSRNLLETTISHLNADQTLTRKSVKPQVASLTIGSASVAAVVAHRRVREQATRVAGAVYRCETAGNELCRSGADEAGSSMSPLMQTDSEALMQAGVALAAGAFDDFLQQLGWSRGGLKKTVCHQVGLAHRKLLLDTLGLSSANDFTTVETLGNTGSAAAPVTLAKAIEANFLTPGDTVALLGIGSGINTLMMGLEHQSLPVCGEVEPTPAAAE